MTEQEYNEHSGIRRSDLWVMNDSPEKFRWNLEHPAEPTPVLLFGSAAHKYILEPESWGDEYCIAPKIDRRTNAGKEEYEKFMTENAGKVMVSKDYMEDITGMAEAMGRNRLGAEMLAGEHERPFFWTDAETGEECKCKVDTLKMVDGKYVVVDYKTTSNAQTDRFNSSIFKYGYHVQAAMYTEGVRIALGLDYRPGFVFVAQEKTAPYAVNVIEVGEDVMNYGDAEYHRLLNKYHECKEVDIWEGYVQDGMTNEAYLPGWIGIGEEEEV